MLNYFLFVFYIYFLFFYNYLACIYEQKLFLWEIVRRKTYINIFYTYLYIFIYDKFFTE